VGHVKLLEVLVDPLAMDQYPTGTSKLEVLVDPLAMDQYPTGTSKLEVLVDPILCLSGRR
jgi:hypothetical protein